MKPLFSFAAGLLLTLGLCPVARASDLALDTSLKVVPILDRVKGSLRFLGLPMDIKRLKEKVLFNLDDGAGRVPCEISIASATFTVESLLLVLGRPSRYQDAWVVAVDRIEILDQPNREWPLRSVRDLSPGVSTAESGPIALVGLYRVPVEEKEREQLSFYYLEDATGKIRVTGKFIPGINFSARHDGLPIKVVGRLKGEEFEALSVYSSRDLETPAAVRYRLLSELFRERREGFMKAR